MAQLVKELSNENRALKNDKKNRDAEEKGKYSKIRNLELSRSTLQRKAENLNAANKSLEIENKKIEVDNDRLQNELSTLGQKLANTEVDLQNAKEFQTMNQFFYPMKDQLRLWKMGKIS